jgi:hypothetical protein
LRGRQQPQASCLRGRPPGCLPAFNGCLVPLPNPLFPRLPCVLKATADDPPVYALGVLDVPGLSEGRPTLLTGDAGEPHRLPPIAREAEIAGKQLKQPPQTRRRHREAYCFMRCVLKLHGPASRHALLPSSSPAHGTAASARAGRPRGRHSWEHRLPAPARGLLAAAGRLSFGEPGASVLHEAADVAAALAGHFRCSREGAAAKGRPPPATPTPPPPPPPT